MAFPPPQGNAQCPYGPNCALCAPFLLLSHGLIAPNLAHGSRTSSAPQGGVERMGEQLPHRDCSETVRGWRGARLAVVDKTLRLAAVRQRNVTFDVEAAAECHAQTTFSTAGFGSTAIFVNRLITGASDEGAREPERAVHRVPDPHCSCGFYATKERGDADESDVWLDVELSGQVISHEKGYRAERQRVLSVVVPCCSWVICKESSVAMSYEPGTPGDYMSPSSSDSWMPWCAAHAPTAEPLVTLSELADMLGTEVVSEAWSA
jgi:hypothetical protein